MQRQREERDRAIQQPRNLVFPPEATNFKLIAGENSEKHVFCRVTNRFAVNLILIQRLP
jgi:hypothetical protein